MTTPLFLAVDASTTAVKALVFDPHGHALAEGRCALTLQTPLPDAYEQDARSWWNGTLEALTNAVVALSADDRARIVALTVTHQRETVVVTDPEGTPLDNALVWMDQRSRDEVKRAALLVGEERLHAISGKPPCTTPSLYKLMELFSRRPELRQGHVADVHAFLARHLVGRSVTSLASADPTGLVDLERAEWSEPLCALLGVTTDRLPELVAVGAPLGLLSDEVSTHVNLPKGIRVYAGSGDGQAAALGAGLLAPGRAYLNLGTAVVAGTVTPRYQVDRAFRTLFAAHPGHFCLESDLKGGTFSVTWLTERLLGLTGKEALRELERGAAALPPGSDGLVFLPYLCGVMNPHWDDDATGLLLGLHGGHGEGHVHRAVLEGIALEQRACLDAMQAASGEPVREIVLMGGGSKSDLWCRILADVLGIPLVRTESSEATALGAAMISAVAHGFYGSYAEAAQAMTQRGERFTPGEHRAFYDALYHEVYQGLFVDVRERMARLGALRRAAPCAP